MTLAQTQLDAYYGGAPRFDTSYTFLGKKVEASKAATQAADANTVVKHILGSPESSAYRDKVEQASMNRVPISMRPGSYDIKGDIQRGYDTSMAQARLTTPAGWSLPEALSGLFTEIKNMPLPKPQVGVPINSKTTTVGVNVVGNAKAYIGQTRYAFGQWDCSAFTQRVVRDTVGLNIGRDTAAQMRFFKSKNALTLNTNLMRPGDIIYFRSGSSPSGRHTGIYIGNGMMIDNAGRGKPIAIRSIAGREIIGIGLLTRVAK